MAKYVKKVQAREAFRMSHGSIPAWFMNSDGVYQVGKLAFVYVIMRPDDQFQLVQSGDWVINCGNGRFEMFNDAEFTMLFKET